MQIHRALKNPDVCIKDPEARANAIQKAKLKRIAKKMEKSRILEIKRKMRINESNQQHEFSEY